MSIADARVRALAVVAPWTILVPAPRAARAVWRRRERGIIPDRAGTHWTPLPFLAGVEADPWNPSRLLPIRRAYRDERAHTLASVRIVYWPDGSTAIDDGHHRLTVAREKHAVGDYQAAWVRVRWLRGAGPPPRAAVAIRDPGHAHTLAEQDWLRPDPPELAHLTPSSPLPRRSPIRRPAPFLEAAS
jgi:hypothetical protein